MQRLSGLDSAFLALETSGAHMHVLATAVVDPSSAPGDFSFETVREMLAGRLHLLPPFRRRLVSVPFDLHYPLWVDDPHFDLDFHLRRSALPSPGGHDELAAFTAEIAGRPLDRSRPLWEMWFVEGVAGGRVAIVTKMHHAAIDGMSGVELISSLYDIEAAPAPRLDVEARPEWRPDHIPTDAELLAYAAASIARQPLLLVKNARKAVRTAVRVAQRVRNSEMHAGLPLTAPRLTMNSAITPHRKVSFASVPLADVKRVKDTFGVKVNDVVLAIATGALRTYLDERGELPDRHLVATIPTSVRTAAQKSEMGNRVSAMFASLPVEIDDPLERLRAIHASTIDAKELHDEIGGETLHDWADVVAPALFSRAMKAYSNLRLADRHRPVHNLVVSNVPGPPFPLYFAGARLDSFFPLGPIFDGAALNLTVISYLDSIGFGFLVCRELVPDVDRLAEAIAGALDELVALAELAELAERTGPVDLAAIEPDIDLTSEPDRDAEAADGEPRIAMPVAVGAPAASLTAAVRPARPTAPRGATGLDRVAPRRIATD